MTQLLIFHLVGFIFGLVLMFAYPAKPTSRKMMWLQLVLMLFLFIALEAIVVNGFLNGEITLRSGVVRIEESPRFFKLILCSFSSMAGMSCGVLALLVHQTRKKF